MLQFFEVIGQATKGSRRIPRHTEAMKDVVTCDKSRGVGNTHFDPGISEWGNPMYGQLNI